MASRSAFVCNAVFEFVILGLDVRVIGGHGLDTRKSLEGFVVAAME